MHQYVLIVVQINNGDIMKESKLGGKKHGMVLIISLGKKGDKDPTHVADPDTKKKALPPEVISGGLLTGIGGTTLTHFIDWSTNRGIKQ